MPTSHTLDRSTMFTCLLDLSEEFSTLCPEQGAAAVTAALKEWRTSRSTDMYAFAKQWLTTVSLPTL